MTPASSLSQTLESEAPRRSPETSAPAPCWPQQGRISFQDVEMRYRDDLPLVLKKLSFDVQPQEMVGIVGRTGSGMNEPLARVAICKLEQQPHRNSSASVPGMSQ